LTARFYNRLNFAIRYVGEYAARKIAMFEGKLIGNIRQRKTLNKRRKW
jgi:hypothetical protein